MGKVFFPTKGWDKQQSEEESVVTIIDKMNLEFAKMLPKLKGCVEILERVEKLLEPEKKEKLIKGGKVKDEI